MILLAYFTEESDRPHFSSCQERQLLQGLYAGLCPGEHHRSVITADSVTSPTVQYCFIHFHDLNTSHLSHGPLRFLNTFFSV